MRKLIFAALATIAISCADATKRQQHLAGLYPGCKVEPATGLVQQNGYEFMVVDSVGQMIAVQFYPWSETKVMKLRNVR
jgi:hypothetical protein